MKKVYVITRLVCGTRTELPIAIFNKEEAQDLANKNFEPETNAKIEVYVKVGEIKPKKGKP